MTYSTHLDRGLLPVAANIDMWGQDPTRDLLHHDRTSSALGSREWIHADSERAA